MLKELQWFGIDRGCFQAGFLIGTVVGNQRRKGFGQEVFLATVSGNGDFGRKWTEMSLLSR